MRVEFLQLSDCQAQSGSHTSRDRVLAAWEQVQPVDWVTETEVAPVHLQQSGTPPTWTRNVGHGERGNSGVGRLNGLRNGLNCVSREGMLMF